MSAHPFGRPHSFEDVRRAMRRGLRRSSRQGSYRFGIGGWLVLAAPLGGLLIAVSHVLFGWPA